MEDEEIYALYWKRNEQAIVATHKKYGSWCQGIAYRILSSHEETEECVSDTYFTVWNNIPPKRPRVFRSWLGKITRNLALDRYRRLSAEKRGGSQTELALEELNDCVSGETSPEDALHTAETVQAIQKFLAGLSETQRNIFLRRYWHLSSIGDIAAAYGYSESRVTSMLYRLRKQLRQTLEKEGIAI